MRTIALVAALLIAGCVANPSKQLSPGMSMADVEAKMGKPASTGVDAAGRTVWFYPLAPSLRETWAAVFASDGRLDRLEQRLTPQNIAKVTKGTTKKEVQDLLGPPWKTYPVQRQPLEEWDYRVTTDLDNDLLIRFTSDGVAQQVYLLHDIKYDRGP